MKARFTAAELQQALKRLEASYPSRGKNSHYFYLQVDSDRQGASIHSFNGCRGVITTLAIAQMGLTIPGSFAVPGLLFQRWAERVDSDQDVAIVLTQDERQKPILCCEMTKPVNLEPRSSITLKGLSRDDLIDLQPVLIPMAPYWQADLSAAPLIDVVSIANTTQTKIQSDDLAGIHLRTHTGGIDVLSCNKHVAFRAAVPGIVRVNRDLPSGSLPITTIAQGISQKSLEKQVTQKESIITLSIDPKHILSTTSPDTQGTILVESGKMGDRHLIHMIDQVIDAASDRQPISAVVNRMDLRKAIERVQMKSKEKDEYYGTWLIASEGKLHLLGDHEEHGTSQTEIDAKITLLEGFEISRQCAVIDGAELLRYLKKSGWRKDVEIRFGRDRRSILVSTADDSPYRLTLVMAVGNSPALPDPYKTLGIQEVTSC